MNEWTNVKGGAMYVFGYLMSGYGSVVKYFNTYQ